MSDRGRHTIQVQQCSLNTFQAGKMAPDVHAAFMRGAVAVSFTEARKLDQTIDTAARSAGYRFYRPDEGDVAVAWPRTYELAGEARAVLGTEGVPGEYGDRLFTVVPLQVGVDTVTIVAGHWPTIRSSFSDSHRRHMTAVAGEIVKRAGLGSRIAVLIGDTNTNDRAGHADPVSASLHGDHITSVYDELGRYPDTYADSAGRQTLDWVATYDRDRRVSVERVRVWPAGQSDHRPVSAWLAIKPRGKADHRP